jgi:hypothetical protein
MALDSGGRQKNALTFRILQHLDRYSSVIVLRIPSQLLSGSLTPRYRNLKTPSRS